MERCDVSQLKLHNSMEKWFPTESASSFSAYSVLQDSAAYLKGSLSLQDANVRSEVQRILQRVRGQEDNHKTKDHEVDDTVVNQLQQMSLENLSDYVRSEVSSLRNSEASLQVRRSKGVHKILTRTEIFFHEFDRFLTAYSGVVSIVALVDMQYGGAASATLSLLFATVRIKAKDEETITSAMRQMSDRLPDFRIFQKIYADPDLGSMLSDAYRDVIRFAREATAYFQRSSIRRTMRSIGKPASFQDMEVGMRDNFSRIRLKCETLLAERVDRLEKRLDEIQTREDFMLVEKAKNALNLGGLRVEDLWVSLTCYREQLRNQFDNDRRRQKFRVQDFLYSAAGTLWQSGNSALIILYGCNERGIGAVAESWLSPVTIDLAQELYDRKSLVAINQCDKDSTVEIILSRIIAQLLELNPAVLRKGQNWSKISSSLTVDQIDKEDGLQTALSTILDLQTDTVYIFLDRPELSEKEDPKQLLEVIMFLAKKIKSTIKIIVTIRTEFWDLDQNLTRHGAFKEGRESSDRLALKAVRLDQRRL